MRTHTREAKIIAAVPCPACRAPIGQPCRVHRGRPLVCAERKQAWQQQRDTTPPDFVVTPYTEGPTGQRTLYMLVAPQTTEARAWLARQSRDWIWVAGAVRVPHMEMPMLNQRIIAAGWQAGESL